MAMNVRFNRAKVAKGSCGTPYVGLTNRLHEKGAYIYTCDIICWPIQDSNLTEGHIDDKI